MPDPHRSRTVRNIDVSVSYLWRGWVCLTSCNFRGGVFYWFFVPLEKPQKMKETYHLNGEVLPAMPVPHDCLIKEISLEYEWLF